MPITQTKDIQSQADLHWYVTTGAWLGQDLDASDRAKHFLSLREAHAHVYRADPSATCCEMLRGAVEQNLVRSVRTHALRGASSRGLGLAEATGKSDWAGEAAPAVLPQQTAKRGSAGCMAGLPRLRRVGLQGPLAAVATGCFSLQLRFEQFDSRPAVRSRRPRQWQRLSALFERCLASLTSFRIMFLHLSLSLSN